MTKIWTFLSIWEVKNAHLGGSKMQKFAKKIVCSKCPLKSFGGLSWAKFAYFGGKKCPFWGSKMPKCAKNYFCSKCPQKVSQIFDKSAKIWKTTFCSRYPQKSCEDFLLPQMPQKVIWGSPMTNIDIFLGPNYLSHAATNTAAYKSMSCFATHSCLQGRQF